MKVEYKSVVLFAGTTAGERGADSSFPARSLADILNHYEGWELVPAFHVHRDGPRVAPELWSDEYLLVRAVPS